MRPLPSGWRRVRLDEVLDQGFRFEKLQPESEYRLLGVRWYAGGAFERERKLGKQIAAKELNRVEEGDFVYNRLFAWKGSFAVITREQTGSYVSGEFPVFRTKAEDLLPEFLHLYFSRPFIWKGIGHHSTGTTNVSRNRWREDNFLSWHLSLPPIAEQHRIVAALHAIDEATNSNAEFLGSLQEARGVLLGGAIRKITISRGIGTGATHLATLNDILADCRYGTSAKCSSIAEGTAVLRIPNVIGGQINLDRLKYATVESRALAKLVLVPGDILIVRTNGNPQFCGRAAVVDRRAEGLAFASYLIRLRVDRKRILPDYLQAYLSTSDGRSKLERHIRTSAGNFNLSVKGLRRISVPLPPLPIQQKVIEMSRTMRREYDLAGAAQSRLVNLRNVAMASMLSNSVQFQGHHDTAVSVRQG